MKCFVYASESTLLSSKKFNSLPRQRTCNGVFNGFIVDLLGALTQSATLLTLLVHTKDFLTLSPHKGLFNSQPTQRTLTIYSQQLDSIPHKGINFTSPTQRAQHNL